MWGRSLVLNSDFIHSSFKNAGFFVEDRPLKVRPHYLQFSNHHLAVKLYLRLPQSRSSSGRVLKPPLLAPLHGHQHRVPETEGSGREKGPIHLSRPPEIIMVHPTREFSLSTHGSPANNTVNVE
jgi:hypothetical protein